MKYNKKHSKEFEFCSTGKKNKFKLVKYCEWDDCDEKGKYKAPKNRNLPREFHWFCFKHIKLYNEEWDYFANCSRIEIETELKRDVTWHRPTWPMGYDRTTYKIENDEHNFLNDKNCDNSNKNQNSFDKKDNLTEAYASLGLKKDSSLLEIKFPVNTSASGILGVTKVHRGISNFFRYFIELLPINLAPPLAIITGSRTIFFNLCFFKVL